MTTLKFKELKKMSNAEQEKKLKDLKVELIKAKAGVAKGSSRTKEIRKIIARIHTLNKNNGNMSKVRPA